MAIYWSRPDTYTLIKMLKQNDCLWDTTEPCHFQRGMKKDAINQILNEIKKSIPHVTTKDIKTKIHTLRSQFRKELRTIENAKKSDKHETVLKEPSLWCYDKLLFLKPHCKPLKSPVTRKKSAIIKTIEDFPEEVSDDETLISKPSTSNRTQTTPTTTTTQRKPQPQEIIIEKLKELNSTIGNAKKRCRYGWLADQMISSLNELTNNDVLYKTIFGIQQLLYEAKIEDISRSADMTKSRPTNMTEDMLEDIMEDMLEDLNESTEFKNSRSPFITEEIFIKQDDEDEYLED